MPKRLVVLLLSFLAGLAGNLLAGWVQQDVWTNLFTLPRLLWMGVAVGLALLLVALLETERALAGNWWWHRYWYLRDVLHDPTLRRWEEDFAQLELAQGRRQGCGATVLVAGERQDLVTVLRGVVAGQRGKPPRALVLGEPGAGKTTGLERLTLELARQGVRQLGLGQPMPVLVRLGNFQEGKLLAYVGQEMQRGARGRSGKALGQGITELVERGRVVLLFDALDEALGERRELVLAELVNLLTQRGYENVSIVLTSRTREDPGSRLGNLPVYEIQDLSDEAVGAFIRAYKRPEHNEAEIRARLDQHRLLEPRGLGRNPFWLRLVVESGAFQGSKGQVLNQAVDMLLAREWDKPRTARSWQRVLPREDQLRETKLGLAWLGQRMTEARQVGLEQDQAVAALEGWLSARAVGKDLRALDVLGLGRDAQVLAYAPGLVRFRHRLLQEFLTAWTLEMRGQMVASDVYAASEWGLQRLLAQVRRDDPHYPDLLVYQQRLRESIALSRQHGDTENRRAERSEIVAQLNRVAQATLGASLNELSRPAATAEAERVLAGEALAQYVQDPDRWETLLLLAGLTRQHGALVRDVLGDGQEARRLFLALGLLWAVDEPDQETRARVGTALAELLRQELTVETRQVAALLAGVDEKGILKVAGELLAQSGDQTAREGAVRLIGEGRSVQAARALVDHLGDATLADTVEIALVNLGSAAVAPLIVALGDEDEEVRQAAIMALGKIGAPAVESLLIALRNQDKNVRWGAASLLGKSGDMRAVTPLLAALRDQDVMVRQAAAEALGKIGDTRAVAPLLDTLKIEIRDPRDDGVRRAAAEALGRIGNGRALKPLIGELLDDEMRGPVVEALGKIGGSAVEPLLAALRDKTPMQRLGAAEALGEIKNKRGVEPLIAALRDEDGEVRWTAAWALGEIGVAAVEPLIATLGDQDERVRRGAASALGRIRDKRAVTPLLAALRDQDWRLRWVAAEALGEIGDKRAGESLLAALQDEDWNVRWAAVEALDRIGELVIEPQVAALRDGVRNVAADALDRIGEPTVAPLLAALRDEDWNVRRAAFAALERIGSVAVAPLLAALRDEDWNVRQVAARALAEIRDNRVVAPLLAALRDQSWSVREAVAWSLGNIGEMWAVEPLLAALGDQNRNVRQAAAWALARIGAAAVEPLIAALRNHDKRVRRGVAEALEEIGDARAMEPLAAALRDPNRAVRKAAAEALRKLRGSQE